MPDGSGVITIPSSSLFNLEDEGADKEEALLLPGIMILLLILLSPPLAIGGV